MDEMSSAQFTYDKKKERFLTETLQNERTKSTHFYVLTREQYSALISQLEEAQKAVTKTSVQLRRLKRFKIIAHDGEKRLILRASINEPNLRYFLPIEEIYDVIDQTHQTFNHAGRDKMIAEISLNYANITREMVALYLSMCETCVRRKNKISKNHTNETNAASAASDYEILVNSRCQIDIIDFQKKPDGKFKFIMVYQDHKTKFTLLRALESENPSEIANNLIDIFLTIGAPCIIQSNNRKAIVDEIIHHATILWPELVILKGSIQNPLGALENINQEIEEYINDWLKDKKNNKWSESLRHVQFLKNRTYNPEIKQSPFKAMFGCAPKTGLGTIPLPPDLLNAIKAGKPFKPIQPQNTEYTWIGCEESSSCNIGSENTIVAKDIVALTVKEELNDVDDSTAETMYLNIHDSNLAVDSEGVEVNAIKQEISDDNSVYIKSSIVSDEASNVSSEAKNIGPPAKKFKSDPLELLKPACDRSEGTDEVGFVLGPRVKLPVVIVSCSCATNCVYNHCACRKRNLQCNPRCHSNTQCFNSTSALERDVKMEFDEEEAEEDRKTTHIMKWLQDTPESTQPGSSGLQYPVPSTSRMTRHIGVENVGSDVDSEFDDEFDLEEYTANIFKMTEAEQEPQLAEAMRRAMDNAVELLVDISTEFSWHADYDSFRGQPEVFSGPTPGPIHDYDDPYDAFICIFNSELMEIIVRETNRYARQTIDERKAAGQLKPTSRLSRWTDTNVDEMYVFIAMFILMGIDVRSSVHEYWLTTGILQMPMFTQLMSYNRFILLSKFLHFTDNSVSQNLPQCEEFGLSAKVAKLMPIISHLNRQFTTLYNLQQEIAIDESLTLFKGRLSWSQGIRSKAARFDIKSFELCESKTGYLYKFCIYTGKNPTENDFIDSSETLAGKTIQVVLDLLRGLEHRGHLVRMDDFYNCPALTRYLKSIGFDNFGTLHPNRKHVPEDIAKAPEDVTKGVIIARHSGDVSCIAWKDSKMVNMISSYHTDETYVGRKAGTDLVKPIAVRDYINTIRGIDPKDQKLSMYLLERKRREKWYVKMFKRLLNASVLNAFIMFSESLKRRGLPLITYPTFRYQLAESLAQKHCNSFSQEVQAVVTVQLRLRRDILHVPLVCRGNDNRSLCRICLRNDIKKKVNFQCTTCDEYMCLGDCWVTWHSVERLPGRAVFSRKSRRRK